MKIAILVEGATETVFKPILLDFLKLRLQEMPKIKFISHDGRIPKRDNLQRIVDNLLNCLLIL